MIESKEGSLREDFQSDGQNNGSQSTPIDANTLSAAETSLSFGLNEIPHLVGNCSMNIYHRGNPNTQTGIHSVNPPGSSIVLNPDFSSPSMDLSNIPCQLNNINIVRQEYLVCVAFISAAGKQLVIFSSRFTRMFTGWWMESSRVLRKRFLRII